jgi:hypothetical protein
MTLTNLSSRIQRVAVYAAWVASACAVTLAGMTAMMNSDWFILWSSRTTGQDANPAILDGFVSPLILVLGFVIIVAALCGGFRRER